jgi:hypothetical protein
MSKVRIVVEWCFKEVITQFRHLDWPPNQKVLLTSVGLQYPVAVLLHNAHVIFHRPQITQYFAETLEQKGRLPAALEDVQDIPALLTPPTLEEYFWLQPAEEAPVNEPDR